MGSRWLALCLWLVAPSHAWVAVPRPTALRLSAKRTVGILRAEPPRAPANEPKLENEQPQKELVPNPLDEVQQRAAGVFGLVRDATLVQEARLSKEDAAWRKTAAASGGADDATLSPAEAAKELGNLMSECTSLLTEPPKGRAERIARRESLVRSWSRVFSPAVAYTGAQLGVSLAAFVTLRVALAASGRGFADVAVLLGGVPLLGGFLAGIDPGLGDNVIALLLVEARAETTESRGCRKDAMLHRRRLVATRRERTIRL